MTWRRRLQLPAVPRPERRRSCEGTVGRRGRALPPPPSPPRFHQLLHFTANFATKFPNTYIYLFIEFPYNFTLENFTIKIQFFFLIN